MNITKELTGELTAQLRVEIREEDYLEKANKVLKDYQRKAKMPGFRPGKVPFGLIKKMYGTAVIAEEVNKLVSEQLTAYIRDNELKLIGYPIPDDEKNTPPGWGSQTDVDLFFNIGLAPEFDLNFSEEVSLDYYQIKASEEEIDSEVKRLTEQYGTVEKVDESTLDSWIDGEIEQLGEDGNAAENGFSVETYIYPKSSKKQDLANLFVGLQTDDMVDFDLREVFPENKEIARVLKVTEKDAANHSGMHRFTASEISRTKPAELNEEFYAKVFPEKEITEEGMFRELVAEYIESTYVSESDKKFMMDASDKLMELHQFSLPEDFLKRLMLERSRGELSMNEIEKDFSDVAKNLKWDLIKQKIAGKFNIKVTEEDLRDYVKNYLINRYGPSFSEEDGRIKEIVEKILSKEEDAERIESDIFNARLLQVMKQHLSLNVKEITLEDFIVLVGANQSHNHNHDHDHDHDHEHDHHHHDHDHDHKHDHHHHDHDHDHDHEGHHHH